MAFLRDHAGEKLLTCFGHLSALRAMEQGRPFTLGETGRLAGESAGSRVRVSSISRNRVRRAGLEEDRVAVDGFAVDRDAHQRAPGAGNLIQTGQQVIEQDVGPFSAVLPVVSRPAMAISLLGTGRAA